MVSPGFGHQNTGRLDDVNCDICHDYSTGINRAPLLNSYLTGSYEMKCDEYFTGCDSDINPHQVNRVMLVTCQVSLPAHTLKMLVSLNILTIFVVVKVMSILFT